MPRGGPKNRGRNEDDMKSLRDRLRDKVKNPNPPAPPHQTPAQVRRNQKHKVKNGDNFYNLADKYGVQAADIVRVNPELKNLKPGMIIAVPNSPLTAKGENFGYDVQMRGRGYGQRPALPSPGELVGGAVKAVSDWRKKTLQNTPIQPNPLDATLPFEQSQSPLTQKPPYFAGMDAAYSQSQSPLARQRFNTQYRDMQRANVHAAAVMIDEQTPVSGGTVGPRGRGGRPLAQGGSMARGRIVGETPLYQIYKGETPPLIDPRSQHVLGLSDAEMKEAGYVWDDEVGMWRQQEAVQDYTFNGAGAYGGGGGYGGYRRYGGGGGRGGGGGGRYVSGAPGSGGYEPPPGTFGLVTWRI